MKKGIFLSGIISLFTLMLSASSLKSQTAVEKPAQVHIELKNNSLVPKKFTVVSYEPGTAGNGTQSFFLLPYTGKSLSFRAGTRLFLADQKQIDTVMSGNPLIGKPWYVLTEKDNKQSINLNGK
jgi:predicted RecA/RadA family phage recombinase